MSELEYRVMWAMSREYRLGNPDDRAPEPLSYERVRRAMGLADARPPIRAVERLVKRYRKSGVIPEKVNASQQRHWICRQLVLHGAFARLADRYGPLPD
jgi:hypothetical protein